MFFKNKAATYNFGQRRCLLVFNVVYDSVLRVHADLYLDITRAPTSISNVVNNGALNPSKLNVFIYLVIHTFKNYLRYSKL